MRNELINILCVHILISSILLLLQEDYEKLIESLPLNIKNIKILFMLTIPGFI